MSARAGYGETKKRLADVKGQFDGDLSMSSLTLRNRSARELGVRSKKTEVEARESWE